MTMRNQSGVRRPHDHGEGRQPTGEPQFWVHTEHEGNVAVLSLFGDLDVASAPDLERRIKRIQWAGAAAIVVDLSGLDFLDSSGLHVLVRAHQQGRDGQLSLLRGSRNVHRVFELTGTDAVLPFAD